MGAMPRLMIWTPTSTPRILHVITRKILPCGAPATRSSFPASSKTNLRYNLRMEHSELCPSLAYSPLTTVWATTHPARIWPGPGTGCQAALAMGVALE